jgi:hypothetical protein
VAAPAAADVGRRVGHLRAAHARRRPAGDPPARRVLVPTYRLQGRYEFRGRLLRPLHGLASVVDGADLRPLELNMFGRQHKELCAPPLEISATK